MLNELDRAGGVEVEFVESVLIGFGLGAPKNEVILPPLGFLLSAGEAERWSALRLRPGLTILMNGVMYRRKLNLDSMQLKELGVWGRY